MAELKVEVKVLDMPEVKAILAHYKKISRRHAWVNGQRTGKARKRGWKRRKEDGKEHDTNQRNCGAGFFRISQKDI